MKAESLLEHKCVFQVFVFTGQQYLRTRNARDLSQTHRPGEVKERNRLAYARDLRSSEGATPNRAVRKGCYMDCYSILRSEGPTSIVFVYVFRCRTYSAHLITHLSNNSPHGLPC